MSSDNEFDQIAEMGAYVKLLEYDNIDGMILLSELSGDVSEVFKSLSVLAAMRSSLSFVWIKRRVRSPVLDI